MYFTGQSMLATVAIHTPRKLFGGSWGGVVDVVSMVLVVLALVSGRVAMLFLWVPQPAASSAAAMSNAPFRLMSFTFLFVFIMFKGSAKAANGQEFARFFIKASPRPPLINATF